MEESGQRAIRRVQARGAVEAKEKARERVKQPPSGWALPPGLRMVRPFASPTTISMCAARIKGADSAMCVVCVSPNTQPMRAIRAIVHRRLRPREEVEEASD